MLDDGDDHGPAESDYSLTAADAEAELRPPPDDAAEPDEPDEPDSESLSVPLLWLPSGCRALKSDFVGVPPLAATNSAISFTNSALRCTTARSSSALAPCFTP